MKAYFTGNRIEAMQPRPTDTPPEGFAYGYDATTNTWSLIKKTNASIDVSILSVARDLLYPNRPKDINVGTKVYVKATKSSGEVIRVKGTLYRVQQGDKVVPYFKQELEPLANSVS